jgi:spore coat polysaccharide biosynthesis protein SpsF
MIHCAIMLQARMGSTRLPGKVLKPILGKPLLAYAVERLNQVSQAFELWVLTSRLASDDPIEHWCQEHQIRCYRGSENDVLDRFYKAAQLTQANWILRVTGDCPLIDPDVIDVMLSTLQAIEKTNPSDMPDYLSNTLERTFPRGLDAELVRKSSLEKAWKEAALPEEREHVTPYIYRHPELFQLTQYSQETDYSQMRWTVDTPEDFKLIEAILTEFAPNTLSFRQNDILSLLEKHPDWLLWNAHVEQIKLST